MLAVNINLYSINELSEQAKERAYADWVNKDSYSWSVENMNTLDEFEKIFPVKVTKLSYGAGGNPYINYIFTDDDYIEELSGVRLLKYILNNYYYIIYEPKTYRQNGKKRISKIAKSKTCCPLTGYYLDDDTLKPIYDFIKNPTDNITFGDLLNKCLNGWISACDADINNYYSMENFIDISEENEYLYREDGRFFY